ncbi:MAG: ribosome-associated protein [Vicingaceae bacterium]|jgi:ribosome-associated protein
MNLVKKDFSDELYFKTSRSGGKGGQHVNKTESRVSLFFNVLESTILSEDDKALLTSKLTLSIEGVLQINSEATRSQLKNKENCLQKFYKTISEALIIQKKRKTSKPSKAAIRKRLKEKKRRSEIKQNRKSDF